MFENSEDYTSQPGVTVYSTAVKGRENSTPGIPVGQGADDAGCFIYFSLESGKLQHHIIIIPETGINTNCATDINTIKTIIRTTTHHKNNYYY